MIEVVARRRSPHGLPRRAFLRAGALALGGLSGPALGHEPSGASVERKRDRSVSPARKRDTAVILLFLSGGPSQHDTFDPKPDAPEDCRGPFRSIPTRLPGVRVSELFPRLAKQTDRLSVLRSVHHKDGSHHHSYHWMMTGFYPNNLQFYVMQRPAIGSVAARFRGANRAGMPAYASIPRPTGYGGPAYLGAACNPFNAGDPSKPDYRVPDLKIAAGLDASRLADRRRLLGAFDGMKQTLDARHTAAAMDGFTRSAFEMVLNPAARKAFDLSQEDARLRDRYGRTRVGQGCLLARRLVEAGVTFVAVEDFEFTEWDLHGGAGERDPGLKGTPRKAEHLDQALSALLNDLTDRGMLERVLVVVTGEFGRTPTVNKNAGRDHWGNVFSVLMAGGGLRHGQVVGASTAKGESPKERPLRPGDVLATAYHVLGIDPGTMVADHSGRPLPLLAEGEAIKELL